MEKIDKGHPMSQSTDFVAQNIETLKTLFPTIVKEGKIDINELQALLGNEVETEEEYYRFTWTGKSLARREANKPSTATLRPDKESSKEWDTTQNIFIEGDNLEVLKLLQKSYANKIKMISIDPPYNTGKDFVYKDNYKDNLSNYMSLTGQVDDEGKRINTNNESDGRYHSNWLNMMYPRLKLARNLLTENGAIFINIDGNEVENLKKVLDEIFGEENHISTLVWFYEGVNDNQDDIKNTHEYVVLYAKSIKHFITNKDAKDVNVKLSDVIDNSIVKNGVANPKSEIILPKGFPCELENGILKSEEIGSIEYYQDIVIDNFSITKPVTVNSGWSSKDILERFIANGFKPVKDSKNQNTTFVIKRNGNIHYLKDRDQSYILSVLRNYGTTQGASIKLKELGLNGYFSFPKPVDLICYLIKIQDVNNNDIFLDFFAGSGTLAESIIRLNKEELNKFNRKFICVQLPEPTTEESEAYKDGYKSISEITKERIRRAGEKIKSELQDDLFSKEGKTIDIGFRAFKLDSSNIRAWDGNPDALEDNLFNAGSNIKENRTEEDVLYEILLKYGLDLTMPIEQKEIAGKQVFNIGMGALFICLGDKISTAVAEGIGKWKEEQQPATSKVIFKDTGFTDVEKTNSMQILKRFGIHEVNTI
jgi:adenine-specific DNA-methyltransferase